MSVALEKQQGGKCTISAINVKCSNGLLKTECRVDVQALGILQQRAHRSCIFGTAADKTRLSLQAA